MAIARFCSECGERLKVKRFSSLLFRSFCAHCSPRFNRARIMLTVALASCAAIGFAVGHYTTTREPFYYIGTPVESSSSRIAAPVDDKPNLPRTSDAPREPLANSAGGTESICGARTKSGKPCQRKVKGGGYCWQHRDKADSSKTTGAK